MKKIATLVVFFLAVCLISGCGYTTSSLLPSRIQKIHVKPFKNKIDFGAEHTRTLYLPLLEVNITNEVINRYLFDGNLQIVDEDKADVILIGELIDYERHGLRYTDDDDVQEYRINIVVSLTLLDVAEDAPMWKESRFVGDTTFFVTGPLAKSENVAITDAIADLAKRIVERTIENW